MTQSSFSPPDDPAPVSGTLRERTKNLLNRFRAEERGYAFNDSGDGTRYAEWFADLLQEWTR